MRLLKYILVLVALVELIVVIVLITSESLEKVEHINSLFLAKERSLTLKSNRLRDSTKKLEQFRYRSIREILVKIIEERAKMYLGRPYVWGGNGPSCFDCSGFTKMVYRAIGIELPRVSRQQAKVGKLVHFNELQKGDIIFFDTGRKYQKRVTHVGIYLEDGKFIHASSGNRRVVITSFNKKIFYKRRFLWGRRLVW